MSTKTQVQWRRAKVLELLSMGNSQIEIAKVLHIDPSIVSRDVSCLRIEAKQNVKRYFDEYLPEEYGKCLVGLNMILKEAWNMSQTDDNTNSDKLKALTLAKECYAMKLELLTNSTVVDDAIRFGASHATDTTLTEKAKSDRRVTLDGEISNRNDIQRSQEDYSWQPAGEAVHKTTNSIF